MHPLAVLVASLLVILPVRQQPDARPGLVGIPAAALASTSFFAAYNRKEAGRRKLGQGDEVIFIPAGALKTAASVRVRTDDGGKTIGIEAFLMRSFIDAPATNAAARRFVRELILLAPSGQHPDLAKFAGHLDSATPPEPLTNP